MEIKNIQDIDRKSVYTIPHPWVFVTGVTGQDGSHMVDYLLRNTNAMVIGGARRLSVKNHENVDHLEGNSRFQLVNFDLTDSHSIYKIVEYAKPDYFLNFAAQSFVASSWDFARQTWESNTTAVLDCLEAIRRMKPDCRFYNAGSSEEFGNVLEEPQDETHGLRPRSPYGASKAAARQLIKVYRESYGIYAVQGWLFNHEGPRRGEEFVTRKITKNVARIFDGMKRGKTVEPLVLGNLSARRDWSDAEDMMDAVWKMVNQEKYQTDPEVNAVADPVQSFKNMALAVKDYVVSSGESHTIRDFVEASFGCVGIKGKWVGENENETFVVTELPKLIIDVNDNFYLGTVVVKVSKEFYRPAEVNILRGDSSKIRNELGWAPKTNISQLVQKMVKRDVEDLGYRYELPS